MSEAPLPPEPLHPMRMQLRGVRLSKKPQSALSRSVKVACERLDHKMLTVALGCRKSFANLQQRCFEERGRASQRVLERWICYQRCGSYAVPFHYHAYWCGRDGSLMIAVSCTHTTERHVRARAQLTSAIILFIWRASSQVLVPLGWVVRAII